MVGRRAAESEAHLVRRPPGLGVLGGRWWEGGLPKAKRTLSADLPDWVCLGGDGGKAGCRKRSAPCPQTSRTGCVWGEMVGRRAAESEAHLVRRPPGLGVF